MNVAILSNIDPGREREVWMNYRIQELPLSERPYEKCLQSGPQVLTDAELLAVILRPGAVGKSALDLARSVLDLPGGNGKSLTGLHHRSIQELKQIRGIGTVKAIQLQCIAELSVRMAQAGAREHLSYDQPETIAAYYMEKFRHEEQEVLMCMMLDTRNHLLGEIFLTRGTVNASLISPRELFVAALKYQAVHIILVHNHPSGDPDPSQEDFDVTHRISEAGELLDIHLLDHIIIGDRRYISFREQHFLP